MTAGRRAIALFAVGILATGIWQVKAAQRKPAEVARPVLGVETQNHRVARPVVRAAAPKFNPVRLESFDGCAPMLRHFRNRAKTMVTAWGLEGLPYWFNDAVAMPGRPRVVAAEPATGSGGSVADGPIPMPLAATGGEDFSTTNIQEADVDEPDLVKTDGRVMFSMSRGRLYAVDVAGSRPKAIGSLGITGWGHEILLSGDRVMVLTNEGPIASAKAGDLRRLSHAAVTIVDVSKPEKMYVVDRVRLEGRYVSARLVNGVSRIVTTSHPTLPFPSQGVNGQAEIDAAVRRNKRIVQRAGADSWLPNFALEHGGRTVASGISVPCSRVSRPVIFAGIGSTTVLTIDPRNPKPQDASTVNADADIVYATTGSLYLSARKWIDPNVSRGFSLLSTQIHKFDISGSGPARYVASGEVRGRALKQWSFSEHEGFLRVATTDNAVAVGNPASQSFVVVLQQRGNELVRISAVRGLGKGETIQGVRFIGDLGYVVTWRTIDPLYVVDLRNPWKPKVAGELKIPGFSAYLHPVGEDRLLGIGRGGTMEGRITGVKASLFDVSNPKKPREISTLMLSTADAAVAEQDHHGFLWWSKTKLAFIPMYTEGAAFRIEGDELVDAGRLSHKDRATDQMWGADIHRAVVMRDALLTISDHGVLQSDLKSLKERSWMSWVS